MDATEEGAEEGPGEEVVIAAQPGQKVTVEDKGMAPGPSRVLLVTARTAKVITCAGGSTWRVSSGWPTNASTYHRGAVIVDYLPEHDAQIARQRAIHRAQRAVKAIDWARMTAEQAAAIEAVVKPYTKEKSK